MSKAAQTQMKAPPTMVKPSITPMRGGLLQNRVTSQTEPTTHALSTPNLGHNFSQVRVHVTVPGMMQTKLTVNQPGDMYEQEADRVAEQVMRMPMSGAFPSEVQGKQGEEHLHRQPMEDAEKEEEETLQAKESPGQTPTVTPELQTRVNTMRGGGQALSEDTRNFMEPRFGHDFSNVRIHTDAQAADTARGVNARAYTVGKDIVFAEGQYAPETDAGRRLLAHELTHVMQQMSGVTNVSHIYRETEIHPSAQEVGTEQMLVEETIQIAKSPITFLRGEYVRKTLEERKSRPRLLQDFNLTVQRVIAKGRIENKLFKQFISLEAQKLIQSVEREFIHDPKASTLDLLPHGEGQKYRDLTWGKLDFPGNKPSKREQENEDEKKLRLEHQVAAREMTGALSKVRPERRVNIGKVAVMTKGEFNQEYVDSQMRPIPGQKNHQLNQYANDSFVRMRDAALRDGVRLIVHASDRPKSKAERNAKRAGNPTAVAKFSAHTLGLAIDFDMSQGSQQYTEVTTRPMQNVISMHESSVHKWLFLHGAAYGWYPYQNEPWHWEYNPPGFREQFLENMPKSSEATNSTPAPAVLQRSASRSVPYHTAPSIVHDVLRSPGQPLDASTRSFMEPRLGRDFSNVRVHIDAKAAESAHSVNALAYTVGRDVVFGAGQYKPGMMSGRGLIAHELTHVVQQSNRGQPSQLTIGSISNLEREAVVTAGHLQIGRPVPLLSTGTSQSIQRAEADAPVSQPETENTSNKEDESLGALDSSIADAIASELLGSTQWHFLREIMRGFIGEVRGEVRKGKDQELITRFIELNSNPRLMWEYTKGYLKGIAEGFWQSITGIWDMLKLIPKAIEGAINWLFSGPPLSETLMIQGQKLLAMLDKVEEKVIKAAVAFLEDPVKGIQNIKAMIDKVSAQAMSQARKIGYSIAQSIFTFLSKPWGEMGEEIGKVVGMILFEVVLALLTEGIGTVLSKIGSVLAKGGRWLLTEGIRILKWVGEAFGELISGLKKLGKTLLGPFEDLVDALGSLIEEVISFFKDAAMEEEGALTGGGRVRIPPESKNVHLSKGLEEGGGAGRKVTTKVEDLKPAKVHPSNEPVIRGKDELKPRGTRENVLETEREARPASLQDVEGPHNTSEAIGDLEETVSKKTHDPNEAQKLGKAIEPLEIEDWTFDFKKSGYKEVYSHKNFENSEWLKKAFPDKRTRPDLVAVNRAEQKLIVGDVTSLPDKAHFAKTVDYANQLARNLPEEFKNFKILVQERYWKLGKALKPIIIKP